MKMFTDSLIDAINEKGSILCAGVDPQMNFLPRQFQELPPAEAFLEFNKRYLDAVAPFVAAAKPQIAFYEKYGPAGLQAFVDTVEHAKTLGLVVIEDGKRGDGGDTAEAYAEGHLGDNSFSQIDALTVQPGIGKACIDPFLNVITQTGKGVFVVTKTSFEPNSFVENLEVVGGGKVWEKIAEYVHDTGGSVKGEYGYSNLGVVMGATYPDDALRMRELIPNAFFLVPGYGAQGGGADDAVRGMDERGSGIIVNSSRGISFAYRKGQFACNPTDFERAAAAAAKFSRDDLNEARERAANLTNGI